MTMSTTVLTENFSVCYGERGGSYGSSRQCRTVSPLVAEVATRTGERVPRGSYAVDQSGSQVDNPAPPQPEAPAQGNKFTRRQKKKTKERRLAARPPRLNEGGDRDPVSTNRFSPIAGDESHCGDDGSCTRSGRLRGKARALVIHLGGELGLKPERELPDRISCGELRPAVRSVFGSELTVAQELSIKTSMKVEKGACKNCLPRFEQKLKEWAEARFQPTDVDHDHVEEFKRTLRGNVPIGWNHREYPYIPSGSGTLSASRLKGGNWNQEEFSDECRVELVFSSGKPRVVTLYSEHNTRVLSPLHASLFSHLERKGWLLVGPPTSDRVKSLTGGGPYRSVDYEGATDRIKSAYVRASIAVLKEQANPPLTIDQERCLDVLGNLKPDQEWLRANDLDEFIGVPSVTGQPMGSAMSFPLLCLVNKTVVDMALTDLLRRGEISFKEWTSHRALINGDDLLTKEPRDSTDLFGGIVSHGGRVGLKTNGEKTLTDQRLAEINSTVFADGEHVKKVNCSALYMKPETEDVVGYAYEATTSPEGFKRVLRANCKLLALAPVKGIRWLPPSYQRVCRQDKKIKRALCSMPVQTGAQQPETNLLPMTERPHGYDLTRCEEIALIHERINKVRSRGLNLAAERKCEKLKRGKKVILRDARSFRSVLYEKKPTSDKDYILSCLVAGWYRKKRDERVEVAIENRPYVGELPPSDAPNKCMHLIDAIRAWKCRRSRQEPQYVGTSDPFAGSCSDWIPFE